MSDKPTDGKEITAEQFCLLWQSARSMDEAVEKIGLERLACQTRASRYRRLGIPLKKFHANNLPANRTKLDVEAITKALAQVTEAAEGKK